MDTFFAGVSAAASVKLASSVDDVIWLSSFLTPNMKKQERLQNVFVYAGVCLFQPCLAYFISTCGEAALDTFIEKVFGDVSFTTDKLLTIVGGIILVFYAIMLGIEFSRKNLVPDNLNEEYDYTHMKEADLFDEEDILHTLDHGPENHTKTRLILHDDDRVDEKTEEEANKNHCEPLFRSRSVSLKSKNSDNPDDIESEIQSSSKTAILPLEIEFKCVSSDGNTTSAEKTSKSLVLIAFFGSMDGLTLYIPLLVGKTFGIFELLIGVSISVIIIVMLCLFITRCKFISDLLQHIPLFAIVSIFATLLLAKGILMT